MSEVKIHKKRESYLYSGFKPEGAPDFYEVEYVLKSDYDALKQLSDAFYLKQVQLENQNEDIKAKLEKAVEALKEIVSYKWCPLCKNEESIGIAGETLRELGVE